MKIKQVYISDENFEKLKGINASALINEMLTEHFKVQTEMSPEQLKKRAAVLEIELEAEKKVEAIENG